ncbi:MAG: helix-turn-helix domain-containing protein [Bacteroidales bacterium]|nr:helix-turn-helix domain-containing protein [Bacteroidales bacterium]
MQDRIRKFLTQEGITPSQFAEEIGVQRSAISHILSGRNFPSYEIITKILSRYKRINPDWLLLGIGNMYRSEHENLVENNLDFSVKTSTPDDKSISNNSPKEKNINSETSAKTIETNQLITNVNKSIDKIVVLYSDKTFEIYSPQK